MSDWRTITTRFANKCIVCAQEVEQGSTVEWCKGIGVKHPQCKQEITGNELPPTNSEEPTNLKQSGGSLKPIPNEFGGNDLLSENWIECMKCNKEHGQHLVLKNQEAVNTHMDLFHKFDGSTKKECFGV